MMVDGGEEGQHKADRRFGAYTDLALTTMRNPFEETAEAAVQLLHDLISGRSSEPSHIVLPSQLVQRGSA